ncbi:MAG: sulfite exporter TauE/SafE family protein [Patescibacteria group bacterium]
MNQILLAFLTGLTTGGLSCFAVQGGLLAGILSEQKKEDRKKTLIMFLTSKFIAHFILGALLGFLGSALIISPKTQGVMQIISGIIIILMALKLSEIHPIFRNLSITAPKFVFKLLRNQAKDINWFTPIVMGVLTILIPCGITQSIMLLSVSSGNFWYGGLILGAFILGTTPVFYILGIASEKILSIKPLKIFAILIMVYLGLSAINSGQLLRGSIHTFQNYKTAIFGRELQKEFQSEITIDVKSNGYSASTNVLKVGVPVKLILKTNKTAGCARAFTIPEYNISKILPVSGTEIIELTPTKLGRLTYTCSMGMYSGSFNVIE